MRLQNDQVVLIINGHFEVPQKAHPQDGIKAISNDKIKSLFSIKFTEVSESHQKSFDQTLKDTFKNNSSKLLVKI